MNAMTPTETERNILEFMCDPDRPRQLLAQVKAAEAAEAKANAAKVEADAAYKLAADELAKAREVQDINTKKSQHLAQKLGELEEAAKAATAAKADDVARMAEWEQRLKAREAVVADDEAELAETKNDLDVARADLSTREAAAAEMIARAERIRAASEV